MAMTREQAIDRAKKLMSLGNSDNPHEAALAVSRAQELLSRHAIEMADLSIGGEEDDPFSEIELGLRNPKYKKQKRGPIIRWKLDLVCKIAEANGCAIFFSGDRAVFCGRSQDAKQARTISARLFVEIDAVARKQSRGLGRQYAASFRQGVVDEIRVILAEKVEALKNEMRGTVSETALVVIDTKKDEAVEWMNNKHTNMTPMKRRRQNIDPGAYNKGRSMGGQAYNSAANERIRK